MPDPSCLQQDSNEDHGQGLGEGRDSRFGALQLEGVHELAKREIFLEEYLRQPLGKNGPQRRPDEQQSRASVNVEGQGSDASDVETNGEASVQEIAIGKCRS
jgi:hypothetical protein